MSQATAVPGLMTGPAKPRSVTLRKAREAVIIGALIGCGLFTLVITASIIVVLAKETWAFFGSPGVSVGEFFTGTRWSPLLGAEKHFGIWPLACGTFLVTAVAMALALPLGLVTAIYLSEYAHPRVRAVLKPMLEVLAGIPTVVFGFFALTVITPGLQWLHEGFSFYLSSAHPLAGSGGLQWLHEGFGVYNAMSAGLAVGVMCLPIVTSLAEDALRAVPRSLREAAYAVGATRFEVSFKVVLPAALSGVIAAFLLAIARAVGETMIVALAAGSSSRLTLDPRQEIQPMTGYMVQIFLGDVSNFGVEYLSAYAVAATLFVVTFLLTWTGQRVRSRFRQVYE